MRLDACLALSVRGWAQHGKGPPSGGEIPKICTVPQDSYDYVKREVMFPMRDGVKLFTSIYAPRSAAGPSPILLSRTPYSAAPYGSDNYPRMLGPGVRFAEAGYVFVTQYVRGRYPSEGHFVHLHPHPVGR